MIDKVEEKIDLDLTEVKIVGVIGNPSQEMMTDAPIMMKAESLIIEEMMKKDHIPMMIEDLRAGMMIDAPIIALMIDLHIQEEMRREALIVRIEDGMIDLEEISMIVQVVIEDMMIEDVEMIGPLIAREMIEISLSQILRVKEEV